MISVQQLGIIKLCKSAIKGTKEIMPDDFNLDECKDIIIGQNLFNLIHYGLKNSDLSIPSWIEKGFLSNVYHLSMISKEYDTISKEFDRQNIFYIPLKGIKTRYLYPSINMRTMCDIDIFIDKKDRRHIFKVMKSLGFSEYSESDHEYIFTKAVVTVELHKRLVPSYNKSLFCVFGDDKNLMLANNNFLYSFIHFVKHYLSNVIDISHLVELEILRNDIDIGLLKVCNLENFYNAIIKTLDTWFCNIDFNKTTEAITNKLFTIQNCVLFNMYKNQKISAWKKIIITLFPPYYWMKTKYHILRNLPILLPIIYIWRIFCAPFKLKSHNVIKTSDIELKEYNDHLKNVGLDSFIF